MSYISFQNYQEKSQHCTTYMFEQVFETQVIDPLLRSRVWICTFLGRCAKQCERACRNSILHCLGKVTRFRFRRTMCKDRVIDIFRPVLKHVKLFENSLTLFECFTSTTRAKMLQASFYRCIPQSKAIFTSIFSETEMLGLRHQSYFFWNYWLYKSYFGP